MKVEWRNRWFRVLIELFPASLPVRRYRVLSTNEDGLIARRLRRRIDRRMRGGRMNPWLADEGLGGA